MWTHKRSIGISVLAAALALSGLSVGVSYGAAQPTTFAVTFGEVLVEHSYPLREKDGARSATLDMLKGRLLDADGTEVGRHRSTCTDSDQVGWWCTHTLILHEGPFTGGGTITLTGLFEGFTGEEMAVVGGTGAYRGANGYATATVDGDAFLLTISLS